MAHIYYAQQIRFVGGPYHGRSLVVNAPRVEMAVLNNKPSDFWDDGTMKTPDAIIKHDTARYDSAWLVRRTLTHEVKELVMLYERFMPNSREAVERWQELRPL